MGVDILSDGTDAVFICNTSGVPFGCVMSADIVDDFKDSLDEDPRLVNNLETLYYIYAEKHHF